MANRWLLTTTARVWFQGSPEGFFDVKVTLEQIFFFTEYFGLFINYFGFLLSTVIPP